MKQDYRKMGYYLLPDAFGFEQVAALRDELSVIGEEINNYGVSDLMHKAPYICMSLYHENNNYAPRKARAGFGGNEISKNSFRTTRENR